MLFSVYLAIQNNVIKLSLINTYESRSWYGPSSEVIFLPRPDHGRFQESCIITTPWSFMHKNDKLPDKH